MTVVEAYRAALTAGDGVALDGLFADDARFVSPFSVWTRRSDVRSACLARTTAFTRVDVADALEHDSVAVLRWHALVGDREVDGVDVLTLGEHGVSAVDVFLRPAAVLDDVFAAMSRSWPRPPGDGG